MPSMIMIMVMMDPSLFMLLWLTLGVVSTSGQIVSNNVSSNMMQMNSSIPPQLNGAHFRITAVEQAGFVNIIDKQFSGYCIDLLKGISRADRANFTFDLFSPSGYGSLCDPPLALEETTSNSTTPSSPQPYSDKYNGQYLCGQSDVTDMALKTTTADMYLGLFYVTPHRRLINQFSLPFHPPATGSLAMVGTAVRIDSFQSLAELQDAGSDGYQKPVCAARNAAYVDFLKAEFPTMQFVQIDGSTTTEGMYQALADGTCDVIAIDYPVATQFVLHQSRVGQCTAGGMPIGLIGEPLGYGLSQYAIGIRRDLPAEVEEAISYWINVLMTCSPGNPNGDCPEGNLAQMYDGMGGTGQECNYIAYPPDDDSGSTLSDGAIAGIVLGCVAVVLVLYTSFHYCMMRKQEKRYRKRFVLQVVSNMTINPSSASHITADEMAEQIKKIGGKNGTIEKEELKAWINDSKLGEVSEKDFDALWNAMDMKGNGTVDAVEFIVFLSACGSEFEAALLEQECLSKAEKIYIASTRLSNLTSVDKSHYGGVDLELSSQQAAAAATAEGVGEEDSRNK